MAKTITTEDFIYRAKALVAPVIEEDDMLFSDIELVYVVWYCKTLQNHKALLSGDGLPYYEVTYNGDTGEIYVATYDKTRKETFVIDEEGDMVDATLGDIDKETDGI